MQYVCARAWYEAPRTHTHARTHTHHTHTHTHTHAHTHTHDAHAHARKYLLIPSTRVMKVLLQYIYVPCTSYLVRGTMYICTQCMYMYMHAHLCVLSYEVLQYIYMCVVKLLPIICVCVQVCTCARAHVFVCVCENLYLLCKLVF